MESTTTIKKEKTNYLNCVLQIKDNFEFEDDTFWVKLFFGCTKKDFGIWTCDFWIDVLPPYHLS